MTPISLEKEIKKSYLYYAMSVIISRALPDVRDGLKPVHRRILFAMNKLTNFYDLPYKKSARIVGEVIGKYHPHGDTAVYDSIVRMTQSFSLRYPLIDGQGNFGSIDGDSAAAMRYTEIRLSKIAHEMLKDLDTVLFIPNYDNTNKIPIVLPAKIPNLLINGCSGIAVGMATNIPPHNLNEVINGCLAYIDNNNISIENLIQYIHGPDFPSGAIIQNNQGLLEAYTRGKGKILITSKYRTIRKNNIEKIIFYEIPYQINKAKLIDRIAFLIKEKKIDGINNLRDESDKDGLRIVIYLKKDINSKYVLNTLYKFTDLQIPYYINMVALHLGKPKLMNLKELISTFIDYRCELIKNRIINDLTLYQKKIHILEGYIVLLPNIDKIINLIKNSQNINEAKNKLMSLSLQISDDSARLLDKKDEYTLSNKQVESILDLKIYRLNNLEYRNILQEYNILRDKIIFLNKVLNNKIELIKLIKQELIELQHKFGDNRLTTIENF